MMNYNNKKIKHILTGFHQSVLCPGIKLGCAFFILEKINDR